MTGAAGGRPARRGGRIARLAAGWVLTGLGLPLLLLPGPGLLFIFFGVGLLSSENRWLRRRLRELRQYRLMRRAMREAERMGVRFDLDEPDDGGPGEPSERPGPPPVIGADLRATSIRSAEPEPDSGTGTRD